MLQVILQPFIVFFTWICFRWTQCSVCVVTTTWWRSCLGFMFQMDTVFSMHRPYNLVAFMSRVYVSDGHSVQYASSLQLGGVHVSGLCFRWTPCSVCIVPTTWWRSCLGFMFQMDTVFSMHCPYNLVAFMSRVYVSDGHSVQYASSLQLGGVHVSGLCFRWTRCSVCIVPTTWWRSCLGFMFQMDTVFSMHRPYNLVAFMSRVYVSDGHSVQYASSLRLCGVHVSGLCFRWTQCSVCVVLTTWWHSCLGFMFQMDTVFSMRRPYDLVAFMSWVYVSDGHSVQYASSLRLGGVHVSGLCFRWTQCSVCVVPTTWWRSCLGFMFQMDTVFSMRRPYDLVAFMSRVYVSDGHSVQYASSLRLGGIHVSGLCFRWTQCSVCVVPTTWWHSCDKKSGLTC